MFKNKTEFKSKAETPAERLEALRFREHEASERLAAARKDLADAQSRRSDALGRRDVALSEAESQQAQRELIRANADIARLNRDIPALQRGVDELGPVLQRAEADAIQERADSLGSNAIEKLRLLRDAVEVAQRRAAEFNSSYTELFREFPRRIELANGVKIQKAHGVPDVSHMVRQYFDGALFEALDRAIKTVEHPPEPQNDVFVVQRAGVGAPA